MSLDTLSKLVSMSLMIRNMLLVLLSSLSSTSSLSMLSSSMCMSIGMDIGIIYLEAGPSGTSIPKRPNGNIDIDQPNNATMHRNQFNNKYSALNIT
jgi:hypothetical protein